MNEHETEQDLEFLREKLALLGEPELPPALSAAALFRRMDEGSLALPEEETPEETFLAAWEGPDGEEAPEEALPAAGKAAGEDTEAAAPPAGKVIPWRKALRRGIPLAACLALVLLVYQGREVGLAKNFSGASPAASAAPSSAAAVYDAEPESAKENAPLLRSYQSADAPVETPEEGQDQSAATASGAPAPAPAPASAAQNSATEKSAADAPADDANPDTNGTTGSDGQTSENPDVGGGEMAPTHPDSGGLETEPMHPDDEEPEGNPDLGWGDPEEEAKADQRDQFIEDQAMAVAARYAPKEGLTPKWYGIYQSWNESFDQAEVNFLIHYYDQEGQKVASYSFNFILTEGDDPLKPHLEFVSCEEWSPS